MGRELDVIEMRAVMYDDEDVDWEVPVVDVRINGVDLQEHVLTAMRRQRPGIDFGGPNLAQCLRVDDVAPPSRHWLGGPKDSELMVRGHAAVLTCSCGIFGCGGTAARITVGPETVTWSDFVDPWLHPDPVGTFTFDRAAYERELSSLR
jgi:hypothetical protein